MEHRIIRDGFGLSSTKLRCVCGWAKICKSEAVIDEVLYHLRKYDKGVLHTGGKVYRLKPRQ